MKEYPLPSDPPDGVPTILFDRLLDTIYPRLNELHGTRESRRFWAILLHRYLQKCIIVGRANLPPRKAPDSSPDDGTVLGPKLRDSFSSREAHQLEPSHSMTRAVLSLLSKPRRLRERAVVAQLSRTSLSEARSMLGQFHGVGVVARYVDRPVGWWTVATRDSSIEASPSRRGDLREIAASVDWPLGRMALDWLPRDYVEEFAGRYGNVRIVRPEDKIIHTNFLADVQSRFVSARYVAEGARLYFYQHGCCYGEIEGFSLHHAESFMADRFLTWGWQLHANDVPFLALRFMTPLDERIRPQTGVSDWLYVNQRPTFPWDIGVTLDIQQRFFGAVDEAVAQQAIVRPRVEKGGGWGIQISEQVRKLGVRIDAGTSRFNDLANRVGLVVFDAFPSTSFLECLRARHPAIAIVPEGIPFTDIARPFYEEFFAMGLLHETPESAAEFVSRTPVSAWWRRVQKSDCLHQFIELFCRVKTMEF